MEIKLQEETKKEKKRRDVIPEYHLDNRKSSHVKRIAIPLLIVALLAIIIYVPPLMFEEDTTAHYQSTLLSGDPSSLQELALYKSNNPQADFDNDGLINDIEANQSGTGIYTIDHDGDGVTDYAELNVLNPPTNPTVYDDGVVDFLRQQDALLGVQCNTPFEDAGVILWADDYSSKARGTVIEVYDNVYMFQHFNGYVQFPEAILSAYELVGDFQTELKQNTQGYYYIESMESPVYVRVHDTPVEPCGCLMLLGKPFRIGNGLAKILSAILPSKGFGLITCKQVLAEDFTGAAKEAVYESDFRYVDLNTITLTDSRFSRNYNTMEDLQDLLSHLENGDVALVSLISSNFGESVVEVRGYTTRNNLILCDPTTGTDYGILQVMPQSARLLDKSGTITRYEYYYFNGCGYTSNNRDRIAVIAYIAPSGEITYVNADNTATDTEPDTDSEPDTDAPTTPATDMEALINQIIYIQPENTTEKVFYQSEDGKKYHRILEGVSLEQYIAHRNAVNQQYGFDYYFSTEGSTDQIYCTTLCDATGNVVFLKYNTETKAMLLRFEAADVEHAYLDEETGYTVTLKPEFFLKEIETP